MKIIFIRHGESEANVANVINDNPARIVNLTARGRAQAEAAAEQLRTLPFTHVYASELTRTQQTAEILLRHHDLKLGIDARLNERHTGMDGLPVHTFNDFIRADPVHIKTERGESFLEMMERLRSFLNEVASQHPDGIVLATSHEHPILAVKALSGMDPGQAARHNIANCEWVEIVWT